VNCNINVNLNKIAKALELQIIPSDNTIAFLTVIKSQTEVKWSLYHGQKHVYTFAASVMFIPWPKALFRSEMELQFQSTLFKILNR
jgi:hypothetical protein